jgi:aryl-alcohol dehydrogenase-like predicted oxidoreductase
MGRRTGRASPSSDVGVGDEVLIATKLAGRPVESSTTLTTKIEGLPAAVIRESSARSRERLGVSRLDLLYAHGQDPRTPSEETVEAFGALVADGSVGLLGVSNHWSWRVKRCRRLSDRPLGPSTTTRAPPVRLKALHEVAAETGATPNQVVLSWLIGGDIPVIPLVGASSVAQLDDSLAAVDLELTAGQRARLNAAQ